MRKLLTALAAFGLLLSVSPTASAEFYSSVNPVQGKVKSLETITLDFSGVPNLYEVDVLTAESMTVSKGGVEITTGSAAIDEKNDKKVVYTLENEITEDGTYTVLIGENAIELFYSEDYSNFEDNSEITLTYTIGEATVEPEPEPTPEPTYVTVNWTGVPADGSTVEEVDGYITIMFDSEEELTLNTELKPAVLWNGEDGYNLFNYELEYTDYYIEQGPKFNGNGTLEVTFPDGYFMMGDEPVKGFNYSFTIAKTESEAVAFADNVESITPTNVCPLMSAPAGTFSDIVIKMKKDVAMNESDAKLVFSNGLEGNDAVSIDINSSDVNVSRDRKTITIPVTDEALADGTYSLSIPSGLFKLEDGGEFESTTLTFTVGWGKFEPTTIDLGALNDCVTDKGWSYIVFIASSDAVEANDNYAIDSQGNEFPGCSEPAVLKNAAGKEVASFSADNLFVSDCKCKMKIPTPITEEGEYILTIPKGFWRVMEKTEDRWDYVINAIYSSQEAYSVTFTVTGMVQPYTILTEGTSFDVYPTVTVQFDKATGLLVPEGATADLYVGNNLEDSVLTFNLSADGAKLVMTPKEDYTKYSYSSLWLIVPQYSYMIQYGDKTVPGNEIKINKFKINQPEVKITSITKVSPDPVANLDEIEFSINGSIIEINSKYAKPVLYKAVDGAKGDKVIDNFVSTINAAKDGFTLSLPEGTNPLEDGNYCLEFPTNSVTGTVNDTPTGCKKTQFFYTIDHKTGLNGLNEENGLVDVYTVMGTQVLRQADRDALNTLEPGIYIVNGKKVVVK